VATDNEDIILEVSARSQLSVGIQPSDFLTCVVMLFTGILGGRACRSAEGAGEAPTSPSQSMDEARARAAHSPADA
jgi:hypothetical protein